MKQTNQNIFNLSDGAKFIGINSKDVKNITLETIVQKRDVQKYLFDKLLQNSSKNLNGIELNSLHDKLTHSKNLIQVLLNIEIKKVSLSFKL